MNRYDNQPNPIHEIERQESRSARYGLTETDRARGCTHQRRYGRTCIDCGDTLDREEL